jgi:hypothetical protein
VKTTNLKLAFSSSAVRDECPEALKSELGLISSRPTGFPMEDKIIPAGGYLAFIAFVGWGLVAVLLVSGLTEVS